MKTNGSVKVGKLEELGHPIQRYLLPLQSIEQALWVILCVTVSAALVFAFDILFAAGATSIRAWIMIVVSSLACSLPGQRLSGAPGKENPRANYETDSYARPAIGVRAHRHYSPALFP